MRRPWKTASIILFTLCLLLGGVLGDRVLALSNEAREILRVYTELLTVAHDQYGGDTSYRDLVYRSIDGMLRNLDPHTNLLTPEAYSSMRERQQSSFYGLGILVGMREGQLTVVTPIEGTPASRLGIRAGDIISTIEGEPSEGLSLDDAVRRLKGPKGTQVHIQIVRQGLDEPLDLTITRDEIPQNTVRYAYMIEPGTGFISLSDFNRGTSREMAEAIAMLRELGMERLLLDLRRNGGGLLDQAVSVADQFLPEGSKIVETRGRTRDSFQEYSATSDIEDLGLPVIVLVGQGTASAAEILAGAIQDHDMGLIVGKPTWGKGLVQTVYSLSYGAGIALTTAKYYTPSGRLIQRDYSSFFDYARRSGDDPEPEPEDNGELFHTDLGRTVYGGGGITPDVRVDGQELDPFIQYLVARSAFFDFAVEYTAHHPVESRDWRPDETLLAEFADWVVEETVATPEELSKADGPAYRKAALRYLHAEVFNSAFGMDARYQVLAQGDPQVRRALELFGEATNLLARRQNLLREVDTQPAIGL